MQTYRVLCYVLRYKLCPIYIYIHIYIYSRSYSFYLTIVKQQIFRLEISMHNAFAMTVRHCSHNLPEKRARFIFLRSFRGQLMRETSRIAQKTHSDSETTSQQPPIPHTHIQIYTLSRSRATMQSNSSPPGAYSSTRQYFSSVSTTYKLEREKREREQMYKNVQYIYMNE